MNFQDELNLEYKRLVTRRHFFKDCGIGIGAMALASLLDRDALAAAQGTNPLAPKQPHFPAKAKRVVINAQMDVLSEK